MDIETIIRVVNLIVGTLVAIGGIIIAVKTYLRAKETILQPMKTEVFKLQLKELTLVLEFFMGREGVRQIDDLFDYESILSVNIFVLCEAYSILFFENEFPNIRPYDRENYYIYELEEFERNHAVHSFTIPNWVTPLHEIDPDSYEKRLELWDSYQHIYLMIPKKIREKREFIRRLYVSPVMPSKIANILQQFDQRLEEDFKKMAKALGCVSKQFPNKYLKPEYAMDDWGLYSEVMGEMAKTSPSNSSVSSDQVVNSVREYLRSDEIFKT